MALALASEAKCGPYRVEYIELGKLYFLNAEGRAEGIDVDVIDALAKRSGCTLTQVLDSRVRIWEGMRAGQVDITVSVIPAPDRAELGEIVIYKTSQNRLLVRSDRAAQLVSLEAFLDQASTATVCVVKAMIYAEPFDPWLSRMRRRGTVVEAADFRTALRLFSRRRCDALIQHSSALDTVVQMMRPEDDFKVVDVPDARQYPSGMLFSKRTVSAPDRELLRVTLLEMVKDGTVGAIVKRYQGTTKK